MKKAVIYWKTSDVVRKAEAKEALKIRIVSVNGESDYNGDLAKLDPYVKEGLIEIRMKDEQEIRRKEVCFDPIQGQSFNRKKVGCGGRKRKV